MFRMNVTDRLSYGDDGACSHQSDGSIAVVHACKAPCHRQAVGYRNNLVKTHPRYLAYETGHHLFLNLIDSPRPLFQMPSFRAFLDFVAREIFAREVLIHCNRGESRAPSLALLYMAKRLGLVPNESYDAAAQAFASQFPYRPNGGIKTWLADNWQDIT